MIGKDIGQSWLDRYDELDLSEINDRRLAVYLMEDFFGKVMTDVGRSHLDIDDEIKGWNLTSQWGTIIRRMDSVSDIEAPDDYREMIENLKTTRNKVAHNYDRDVNKKWLNDLRNKAEDWREWIIENSRDYYEKRVELDEAQLLANIAENAIMSVLNFDFPILDKPEFDEKYTYLPERASSLKEELGELRGRDNVTIELITLLEDAHSIEQSLRELEADIEEYKWIQEQRAIDEYDSLKDMGAFDR